MPRARRPGLVLVPFVVGAWVACSAPRPAPDVVDREIPDGRPPVPDASDVVDATSIDARATMDAADTDASAGMDAVFPEEDAAMATDAAGDADMPETSVGTPILTYGGTVQRTLANRTETHLPVDAVRTAGRFGRDPSFHAAALDGDIYTAPLYLPTQLITGAVHDVLYVGTQGDTVWALDAATGAALWHTNLGSPVQRGQQPCGNIVPQTGVLGGMAIDPATHTLYAVGYTSAGGANVYTINALDTATGAQRGSYPQPIAPPASNGSTWTAVPQGERGAITFVNGRVYVPFGGLAGDCGTYHGWVVGIDAAAPTHQTSFATPGTRAGIWAPGGIASDGTHLFVATGNGRNAGDMGDYVIQFDSGPSGPTLASSTMGFFAPHDRLTLDSSDIDIGSTAPVVLPDVSGSSTPHLLFEAGKGGVGYLLNRDNLGGVSASASTDGVFSSRISSGGAYGATAAWSDGAHAFVFVPIQGNRPAPCAGAGGVVVLRLGVGASGASNFAPIWCTAGAAEGAPSVSSNGNSDAILWVAYAGTNTVRAYSIDDGTAIWVATDAATIRKWVPPLVADGRMFITGTNTVTMYRLLR